MTQIRQQQQPPGSQAAMEPVPDCGEASYVVLPAERWR